MERVRGVRTLTLLVLTWSCILVGACRSRPAGEGPYADRVDRAMADIERTLGVKFKSRPRLALRSRDSVRAYLLRKLELEVPERDRVGLEASYKAFGLIPDTLNLNKLLVDAYTEQIVGYYDAEAKLLYVVEGLPDEIVGATVPHEIVHALQDQYKNLDSLVKQVPSGSDRATALLAVIEGEAQYVQMLIAAGGASNLAARLPGGWDQLRESIRQGVSGSPRFAAAPLAIQEEMLFPYINGADFVRRFAQHHPGMVPLDSAPLSTEQVLHDRAFFGAKRDDPTPVSLPSIPGSVYSNDLGEFGTRLFLYQHSQDSNGSIRAAVGWDGDRFVVYRTAGGMAVAWATVWDTPLDAAELVTATTDAMKLRYRGTAANESGAYVISGQGRVVRLVQREIDGRDVVLFTDVPASAISSAPDIARVHLGS